MNDENLVMWGILALIVITTGSGYMYWQESQENTQLRETNKQLEADKTTLWEQKQYFKDESESNMMMLLSVKGELRDLQDKIYWEWLEEKRQKEIDEAKKNRQPQYADFEDVEVKSKQKYPTVISEEPLYKAIIEVLMTEIFKLEPFETIEYITVEFSDCQEKWCVMAYHYSGKENYLIFYINKYSQVDDLPGLFYHEMRHRYDYLTFGRTGDNESRDSAKHFLEQRSIVLDNWMLKKPLPTSI